MPVGGASTHHGGRNIGASHTPTSLHGLPSASRAGGRGRNRRDREDPCPALDPPPPLERAASAPSRSRGRGVDRQPPAPQAACSGARLSTSVAAGQLHPSESGSDRIAPRLVARIRPGNVNLIALPQPATRARRPRRADSPESVRPDDGSSLRSSTVTSVERSASATSTSRGLATCGPFWAEMRYTPLSRSRNSNRRARRRWPRAPPATRSGCRRAAPWRARNRGAVGAGHHRAGQPGRRAGARSPRCGSRWCPPPRVSGA
jgi:hypothetical protein